jgi:hypothetical protein
VARAVTQPNARLGDALNGTGPGAGLAAAGQRYQSGEARFPSQLGVVIGGDRAGDQG